MWYRLTSCQLFSSTFNCKNSRANMSTAFAKVTRPANIGDKLSAVDTPSLVVHKTVLERNLQKMRDYVMQLDRKVLLRPHSKTHKCAALARLQIEKYGAIGMCCQKLDEAEALFAGGINDIFVTNEIIGDKKINRLCQLAAVAKISVVVDDMSNVAALSLATAAHGVSVDVLIEVNGGQNRCGVNVHNKTATCVQMAQAIVAAEGLRFKGIHCYGGSYQHVRNPIDRRRLVMDGPVARARTAHAALQAAGIECEIVTGAGTGTFPFEVEGAIHNEIQPGSYALMDVDYALNDDGLDMFENALFVHTAVMSKSVDSSGRAVVDAGMKAVSLDSGPPRLSRGFGLFGAASRVTATMVSYECGGDEHGILVGDVAHLHVGDTVQLIPGHVDPTVNLHHFFVVVDKPEGADPDEEVEPVVVDIWEIEGQGPGF